MSEATSNVAAEPLICSRPEAAHLHAFFLLLARGDIARGSAEGTLSEPCVPIKAIRRREHDGERVYEIRQTQVVEHHATRGDLEFPRQDMADAADFVLDRIRQAGEDEVNLTELVPLLDAMDIFDLQPQTDDRTSLHIQLWSAEAPFLGVRLQSAVAGAWALLDGGRTANLKFEQQGVRFHQPAIQKINAMGEEDDVASVARRILYVEGHGGIFRYADVADRVFRSNLLMLDTNLPRILAAMLRILHLDGTNRVSLLVELLKEQNPLKVKDELVRKHGFYEHKISQFLLALAWGMRPAKQWNGRQNAIEGLLVVDIQGQPMLYTRQDEQLLADWLLASARLEKTSPHEAHYGELERENGVYYMKLNLKVTLPRRK